MSNIVSINMKAGCVRCGYKGTINKFCLDCQMKSITHYPDPKFRLGDNDQQYAYAPEAFAIGWDLIKARHKYLISMDIRVEFIFLKNAPIKNGNEVWGRAKKVTGLNAWLATEDKEETPIPKPFFVLEFSYYIWKKLTPEQRVALVEHELCHCTVKEGKPSMRGHDHEEFIGIIKIHGLWTETPKKMIEAGKESERNPLFQETIISESYEEDFENTDDFDEETAA